ncbi:MAG: ArnT family glycosyltransferase [Candidatus Kariarchaeaceae archaeon]|jgi:4-amino-4-deoxy-L-arabinose transferase-like glycosyltransferase
MKTHRQNKGRKVELENLRYKQLKIHLLLLLLFLLAFILRILLIDEYGLSEDEVLKALAAQDYQNFDFSSNAQHPALMKFLVTLSVIFFGESEFAIRLPNVFISSLTIYPIFYLGRELFNENTGILAGFLWTVDIPSISFSTIAKEDSLLTFFWILTILFFIKSFNDPRYLQLTGICVGFAFASKYVAFILVLLLFIIYFTNRDKYSLLPIDKVLKFSIPLAVLVFIVMNFPIFIPSSLEKMFDHYILHKRPYPPRTGRFMMNRLFFFRPAYWFLLFIVVKIPISFLIILFIGLWYSLKYRSLSHKVLLLWILITLIIFSITGGFTRYILIMIPAFVILSANGVLRFSEWLALKFSRNNKRSTHIMSKRIAITIILLTCLHSIFLGMAITPYYRMYVNELGGRSDKAGYYFPQDSVYDYQLREAIYYVNEQAPYGSVVAIHVPLVGNYYGRPDLDFISISELPSNIDLWNDYKVSYAIVQESRIYFENEQHVRNLQITHSPSYVGEVLDIVVVEVYSI